MDTELSNGTGDWLQHWRKRAGLEAHEVDRSLSFDQGTTARYEEAGFSRTPLCRISRLANLYAVPPLELHSAVEIESQRIRHLKQPQ